MRATTARGRAAEPGDVTATILDVAGEMLAQGGLDALQLRDVAAQARVSLTTVYGLSRLATISSWLPSNDGLQRTSTTA